MLVFFGLPALELLDQFISNGAVIKAVSGFFAVVFQFAFGQPQNTALTCLVLFAAMSGLSWLLMRRAVVK